MGLGAQVVHLVRLDVAQQVHQRHSVGEVGVMQHEVAFGLLGSLVDVVDPLGVEAGRPPQQAVDPVPLRQQQLRQVRAVLPGHAGDQCGLGHAVFPSPPDPSA
ncbi:hypothetical protein MBT84_11820 [Streptomyces sp. MBT84]|nr:hypothetical protein [Streptomyces sp. MBT84]